MVHITPESVEQWRKTFKEQYGVDYSDQEAREAASNLVGLFDLLLKMDRKQHPENYEQKQNSDTQSGVK